MAYLLEVFGLDYTFLYRERLASITKRGIELIPDESNRHPADST